MKTIHFLTIVVAALLTSCSNDDEIRAAQEVPASAIGFNTTVNKTGRAITDATVSNMEHFHVWGYQSPTEGTGNVSTVFDNQEVTWPSTFTYTPLRYWTAGNFYWFCAYYAQGKSDAISFVPDAASWPSEITTTERPLWGATIYWNNGTGTATLNSTELTGTNGDADLIYAWWKPDAAIVTGNEPTVDFAFKHLLSKVAFKFVNALPNNSIKITALTIQSVEPLGTLDMTVEEPTWVRSGTPGNVNYVNDLSGSAIAASAYKTTGANCLIPGGFNYNIAFTVQQIDGTNVLATYHHTATVSGLTLEMGVSYVLTAEITTDNINPDGALVPIEFNPTVEAWDSSNPEEEVNIPDNSSND